MIRRMIPWFLAPYMAACSSGPVAWEDSVQPTAALHDTMLVREPDGRVRRAVIRDPRPPVTPAQCVNSVRTWRGESGPTHAAWWSLRPDQSADLMASSTRDGKTWAAPIRVDTADAGRTGCDRPPPGLFVDGANVHIVYPMRAREGPGIFLSHSMDGGALFHSPVAVVYGEKPGLASVAASGNFVVVAYEDPNTNPTRISVAISTTMAHLFDFREVVSLPGGAVAGPQVVVSGSRVLVSWMRASEPGSPRIGRAGVVR